MLLGTTADLGAVNCDSFHVAGYTDHITRWRACYSTTQVLGGDKELTVVKSGHIQSFVNPAATGRYDCWYGPPTASEPDKWLSEAAVQQGSWWQRWADWLIARSGARAGRPADPRQPRVPAARHRARYLRALLAPRLTGALAPGVD